MRSGLAIAVTLCAAVLTFATEAIASVFKCEGAEMTRYWNIEGEKVWSWDGHEWQAFCPSKDTNCTISNAAYFFLAWGGRAPNPEYVREEWMMNRMNGWFTAVMRNSTGTSVQNYSGSCSPSAEPRPAPILF